MLQEFGPCRPGERTLWWGLTLEAGLEMLSCALCLGLSEGVGLPHDAHR